MPKSPKGPRKAGRKSARMQRGQALFTSLCALFRPHVEPLIRKDCLQQLSGPPPTEEQVQQLLDALREHLGSFGAKPEDIDEALKEAETRIRDPKSITPEEIEAAVDDAATEETGMLVMTWLNVLTLAAYPVANFHVLELKPLDDAMLPPMDERMEGFFSFACTQKILGEGPSKDVLRAVKAALPAGEQLPAVAIELLEHEGLTVIK
ncbi:MAG TPA: hypothetical protein VL426_03110 [Candidatus Binatia bacterium]|nr:hypothetical protein [Candidatus Binatia bacterium]